MRNKTFFLLLVSIIILLGCSQAEDVSMPGDDQSGDLRTYIRPPQLDRWCWETWVFQVNEGHTSIEAIPIREVNLHYNVLKFVEGFPCPNCLQIGDLQPQGDGTFKVEVKLRHPFPWQPEYTGFDVRGTVVFPATHYWTGWANVVSGWGDDDTMYYHDLPLHFSRSSADGGELLNADGYSFYLFPGFPAGPDIPICRYQDGKYATGTADELDSTINPYIEFHDVDERRMFTCNGQVTRTYHIKPPAGAFTFGYIVDASWMLPTNMPVTDPAKDFPDGANAEDGYSMGANVLSPIVKGSHGYIVAEWTIRHRKDTPLGRIRKVITYCPDIPSSGPGHLDLAYREFYAPWCPEVGEKEMIDPWTSLMKLELVEAIDDDVEPGFYLIILTSLCRSFDNEDPAYFRDSPTIEFMEVEVVE